MATATPPPRPAAAPAAPPRRAAGRRAADERRRQRRVRARRRRRCWRPAAVADALAAVPDPRHPARGRPGAQQRAHHPRQRRAAAGRQLLQRRPAGRRAQAFEAVPWVRRAVVRRVWPDRLAVRLEEHRAAALWEGMRRRRRPPGQQLRRGLRGQRRRRRGRGLPSLQPAPKAARPQMLALYRRLQPVFARAGPGSRAAAAVGPRLVARRARQRRRGRTRPRQRGRAGRAHASASCAR